MIITCINCAKKFDVDSNIIPEKGRLLECNGCNHRWFFNKEIITEPVVPIKIESPTGDGIEPVKIENSTVEKNNDSGSEIMELMDSSIKPDSIKYNNFKKKKIKEEKNQKNKVKKSYSILALTLVFIISIIAVVIVADTFKNPIGEIFPNFEFLLYNLYESIKDFVLFFKDLI